VSAADPVSDYGRALARHVRIARALSLVRWAVGGNEGAMRRALGCSHDELRELRSNGQGSPALLRRLKGALERITDRPCLAPLPLIDCLACDGYDYALRLRWIEAGNAILRAHLRRPGTRWRAWLIKDEGPLQWSTRFAVAFAEDPDALAALYRDLWAADGERSDETLESFVACFDRARSEANPSLFTKGLAETIYPLVGGGVVIRGDYHAGVNAIVKEMRGAYLPAARMWRVEASAVVLKNNLDAPLRLRPGQVVIERVAYALLDDALVPQGPSVDAGPVAARGPGEEDRVADERRKQLCLAVTRPLAPFDYSKSALVRHLKSFELWEEFQPDGVRHLVGLNSALLADDMGLGKSRQAVVAADFVCGKDGRTLIVCPASLIENWRREILKVLPEARVSKQGDDTQARWVVTNYENLGRMIAKAETFRVMITDEAHYLKEPSAQRTRLAFEVAAKIPHRYLLTGTPVLNREAEIHSLLRLSGHPIGNLPLPDFLAQFAGSGEFRSALNARLDEWMLRRTKERYLSLKGKRYQRFYLTPTDEQQAQYRAEEAGEDLVWMAKMHRLRQLLETIKLDYIAELVTDLRPADKVLVFCEYKETVSALQARLAAAGVVSITGDLPKERRQGRVDTFTDDPNVRVLVGTTAAMAEGLNIQAANYVVFAGLPWTPTKMRQAEDRAYRGGQRRVVFVKIPMLEGSIDEDLWDLLERKRQLVGEVVDAAADAEHEEDIKRELAERLRQRRQKPRRRPRGRAKSADPGG
jgi:superfamily II DNA or RNA helicase